MTKDEEARNMKEDQGHTSARDMLFGNELMFEFGPSEESLPHPHLMGAGAMVAQGLFVPPSSRPAPSQEQKTYQDFGAAIGQQYHHDEQHSQPVAQPVNPKRTVRPAGEEDMNTDKAKKKAVKTKDGGRGRRAGAEEEDEALRAEKNSEWVKRRREQVAKASRAAREKRKREVQGLRKENKRLRDERDDYLDEILQLQLKVETLREEGSIDIQLENELLKAQLEEHKRFVGGFMKLAMGVPSSEIARRVLYKQGSDYAVGHVLSLISQSAKNDWALAAFPSNPFSNSGPRPLMNACYQFVDDFGAKRKGASHSRQRLNLRIDMAFPFVDMETVTELYWKVWNDEREHARVYGLKPSDGYEFKRLHMEHLSDSNSSSLDSKTDAANKAPFASPAQQERVPPSISTETGGDSESDSSGATISVAYYREKYQPPLKDRDWVFVATKQLRDMARSTLVRQMRPICGNGTSTDTSNDGAQKSNSQAQASESTFTATGTSAKIPGSDATKNIGAVKCNLLARSTTQHLKAPNHENTQRITSLLVEGALFWREEDERTGTSYTRLAVVLSMPDDIQLRTLNGFRSIITENGALTDKFGKYLNSFMEALASPLAAAMARKTVESVQLSSSNASSSSSSTKA